MKNLLLLIIVVLFSGIFSSAKTKPLDKENIKMSEANADELSMVRLQNKMIAGIEASLNPSRTADDGNMLRTLASFRIGYRIKQHVMTGSLGVEFTDQMLMPITFDYKYYLKYQNVWSPYIYGQVGYGWHLKGNINSHYHTSNYKQIDPGALASVGFGYSYTTNLNEFYFSVGYSYRNYVEVKPNGDDTTESIDKSMNGIAFTLGINF
jgi:hypothetical protein